MCTTNVVLNLAGVVPILGTVVGVGRIGYESYKICEAKCKRRYVNKEEKYDRIRKIVQGVFELFPIIGPAIYWTGRLGYLAGKVIYQLVKDCMSEREVNQFPARALAKGNELNRKAGYDKSAIIYFPVIRNDPNQGQFQHGGMRFVPTDHNSDWFEVYRSRYGNDNGIVCESPDQIEAAIGNVQLTENSRLYLLGICGFDNDSGGYYVRIQNASIPIDTFAQRLAQNMPKNSGFRIHISLLMDNSLEFAQALSQELQKLNVNARVSGRGAPLGPTQTDQGTIIQGTTRPQGVEKGSDAQRAWKQTFVNGTAQWKQ